MFSSGFRIPPPPDETLRSVFESVNNSYENTGGAEVGAPRRSQPTAATSPTRRERRGGEATACPPCDGRRGPVFSEYQNTFRHSGILLAQRRRRIQPQEERAEPDVLDASAAQPQTREQQAKAHYEQAAKLYESGSYWMAVLEFTDGYLLHPNPDFFFNIALCYRKMDEPAKALAYFRRYLKEGSDPRQYEQMALGNIVQLEQEIREAEAKAKPPPPPPPDETAQATLRLRKRGGVSIVRKAPVEEKPLPSAKDQEAAEAHVIQALQYMAVKKYGDAVEELKKAYALFPDPLYLLQQGDCYIKMGMAEAARSVYEKILGAENLNDDTRYIINALMRNVQVRSEMALIVLMGAPDAEFEQTLEFVSKLSMGDRRSYAEDYQAEGERYLAREFEVSLNISQTSFERSYRIYPDPFAFVGIGDALLFQGKFQEAGEQYKKYLADPRSSVLGRRTLESRLPQLREMSAQALPEKNVIKAERHFIRGCERFTQGRYTDARLEFMAAWNLNPHAPYAWTLGKLGELLGRPGVALDGYKKYVSATNVDPAKAAVATERIAMFEDAISRGYDEHDPDGPAMQFTIGERYFFSMGFYRELIKTLEKRLKTHPDDIASIFLLAEAHRMNGDPKQALASYQRWLGMQKFPEDTPFRMEIDHYVETLRAQIPPEPEKKPGPEPKAEPPQRFRFRRPIQLKVK